MDLFELQELFDAREEAHMDQCEIEAKSFSINDEYFNCINSLLRVSVRPDTFRAITSSRDKISLEKMSFLISCEHGELHVAIMRSDIKPYTPNARIRDVFVRYSTNGADTKREIWQTLSDQYLSIDGADAQNFLNYISTGDKSNLRFQSMREKVNEIEFQMHNLKDVLSVLNRFCPD